MIVQRPVIITAQDVVQIDIEPAIAGQDPPAADIGISFGADDEIRIAPETREEVWLPNGWTSSPVLLMQDATAPIHACVLPFSCSE